VAAGHGVHALRLVEAAANILTNPQLDPYGKIPEFKFSKVGKLDQSGELEAAE
jgi:formate dehydrogenase major subunit